MLNPVSIVDLSESYIHNKILHYNKNVVFVGIDNEEEVKRQKTNNQRYQNYMKTQMGKNHRATHKSVIY